MDDQGSQGDQATGATGASRSANDGGGGSASPADQQDPSATGLLSLAPEVEGDWHLAGDDISIDVIAKNTGSVPAEDLVIRALAPTGMTADDSETIPVLHPGDEVALQVTARTVRRNFFRPQTFEVDLNAVWRSEGKVRRAHQETTVEPKARFLPDYAVGLLIGAVVGMLFYVFFTPGLANARDWLSTVVDSTASEWDGSFIEDIAWPAVSGVLWWVVVVAATWFLLFRMYHNRESGQLGGITVNSWTGALIVGVLAPWFILGATQGFFEGIVGIGDQDGGAALEQIVGEDEPTEPPADEEPTEPPADEPTEAPADEPTEVPADEEPTPEP